MNPYEPPQEHFRQRRLPVADLVKPARSAWHNDYEFVRRNQVAMFINCLIPWVIAAIELALAKPKQGFLRFDFLPGIVWLLMNLIWLGCLLGLSWTQRKQFVQGLFWLLIVALNFAGAILLRNVFAFAIPPNDSASAMRNYLHIAELLGKITGIFSGISFLLMLLLRFRSRLVDREEAERESSRNYNFQWSLWSMIYFTFLIAAVTAGLHAGLNVWLCLYPLYMLLLWHEFLQPRLRIAMLLNVLAFGIGMQLVHFKIQPSLLFHLRDTLEMWIPFNLLTLAFGITARWAGWRIVRRPPLKMDMKKFVNRHVILTPEKMQ